LFPTLATWIYFILLSGRPQMGAVYAATKVVQFAFPLVWVIACERQPIRLARPQRAGMGQGLVLGVAVLTATLALYYGCLKSSDLLVGAGAEIAAKMAGFGIDSLEKYLALAVFLTLLHSLLEEYYWRWFVFGRLNQSVPFAWAVVVSSMGFMAHHVLVIGEYLKGYGVYTWCFSLCVAVGGASWAWIYRRTRSLYGPWLSHLLVDAGLMWIGYDLWRSTAV
jgi:membrane protease YdiL (CAAX protease family)